MHSPEYMNELQSSGAECLTFRSYRTFMYYPPGSIVQQTKVFSVSRMAVPVKFYYDLLSPPARALLTFFKMANIPIEEKAVALRKGEHRTNAYQKNIGRFGKVPVIHDGDFQLNESIAILRYMVARHSVEDFWYPKDPKERARVDEYLSWTHNNNRIAVGMAFFTKFRDPLLTGKPADPEKVKKYDIGVQKALDDLEKLWTTETKYISGNKMTIADVFASCDLEQSRMTGVDPLVNRPKLAAWFNRTRKQLEPYFTEHHKFVYVIEEMMKNKKAE